MDAIKGIMGTDEPEVRAMAPILKASAMTVPLAFAALSILGAASTRESANGLIAWMLWLGVYYLIFYLIPRRYRVPSRSAIGIRLMRQSYNEVYYKVALYSPAILAALIIVSVLFYNRIAGGAMLAVFLLISFGPSLTRETASAT